MNNSLFHYCPWISNGSLNIQVIYMIVLLTLKQTFKLQVHVIQCLILAVFTLYATVLFSLEVTV